MQNYHSFVSHLIIALALIAVLFLVAGCSNHNSGIEFIPGTYSVSSAGYGGAIDMDVTFGSYEILSIDVVSENETKEIGHMAIPKMIESIIASNGLGVDAVTGATITCNALKAGVREAAATAQVSDLNLFDSNRKAVKSNKKKGGTWDIVVIGAGGAGLAAAAQAAQDGNTVLVIEKTADIGGNTVVSGGVYQSATPFLVWDPENPDAETGIGPDGQAHIKVKSVPGCIETLRTILGWSEAPFDAEYYNTHEFVAGDIEDLAERGVHPEYLDLLRRLKKEITEYLDWADRKMGGDGTQETDLALFSTNSLHIFQTYYGGLRPSNDNLEWCYGDFDLVSQFVNESQELRPWLTAMGVEFTDEQTYVVGGLWYRMNRMLGANVTIGGKPEYISGNLGTYVMAPYSTFLNADRRNTLMTMTTAGNLIFAKGRVRGVEIVRRNGSKDKVFARKGVIIATGGYSANIAKVLETNKYWPEEYLTANIRSTNRASMMGDGIEMAEKVGAGVTGMGWTQLMPLSYIDDGQIAFGEVDNSIFVSPKDGRRFVDEASERDVLSFKGFENGIKIEGLPGVYFYIVGNHDLTPLLKLGVNKEMRQYTLPLKDLDTLFQELGLDTDSDTVIRTIREYDNAIMNGQMPPAVPKKYAITLIGTADKRPDGTFDKSTYRLDDDSEIILRLVAPATHHTMGGLTVNTRRQVLDGNGHPIDGLFAAGEVTGGIHGGNRLGGNALTEIMVSGRIAAKSAQMAR